MEKTYTPISYYKINLLFRISAAVFVSLVLLLYGEPFSALKVLLMPVFYLALLCSFVIAFILISIVRIATLQLDKRVAWDDKVLPRLMLQFIFGLAVPCVVAYLLAALYFFIRGKDIEQTDYALMEFPIVVFMLTLLNICYFVHYKYSALQAENQKLKDDNARLTRFIENQDYANKMIDANEIFPVTYKGRLLELSAKKDVAFIYSHEGNWVVSKDGRRYGTDLTLDEIAVRFSDFDLIRVNRQCVIHRSVIENVVPRNRRDTYIIHLKDEFAGLDKVKENEKFFVVTRKYSDSFLAS